LIPLIFSINYLNIENLVSEHTYLVVKHTDLFGALNHEFLCFSFTFANETYGFRELQKRAKYFRVLFIRIIIPIMSIPTLGNSHLCAKFIPGCSLLGQAHN